jgi:hypothetical protein
VEEGLSKEAVSVFGFSEIKDALIFSTAVKVKQKSYPKEFVNRRYFIYQDGDWHIFIFPME